MKNAILAGLTRVALRGFVVIVALSGSLLAQPLVKTMGGGTVTGSFGYRDTNTLFALFHTPMGMAVAQNGLTVFVADRDNNAVRFFTDFPSPNNGYTFTLTTNFLSKPVGVALDSAGDVYVLNRGSTNTIATNGTVLEFDQYGFFVMTNASGLTNAAGMLLDPFGNIYVTERSNLLVEITNGTTTVGTVATVTAGTNVSLQGIALLPGGQIAACDSGRNGIYIINPSNGGVTTNAGFNGQGDGTGINNQGLPTYRAKFFQPMGVAAASDGTLIISDFGNGHVKVITTSGIVTNLYGVISNDWTTSFKGWVDGQVVVPDLPGGVAGRCPQGVALSADGATLYTTEDFYHLCRRVTGQTFAAPIQPLPAPPTGLTATLVTNQASPSVILTWNSVSSATQYAVRRSTSPNPPYGLIGTTTGTSFTDGNVLPGNDYYYVVQSVNSGGSSPNSSQVGPVHIPVPPPLAPQIGWFDFELNAQDVFVSVLHPVPPGIPFVVNNPMNLAIEGTPGITTYYVTLITNPPANNMTPAYVETGSAPPVFYTNQLASSQSVTPLPSLQTSNGLVTVEAVNVDGQNSPSSVTSASFLFEVAPIQLNGTNAAQFTLFDVTTNLTYVYTTDGSDPLTSSNAQQLITSSNTTPFSINIGTNFVFTVVGEDPGFATSQPLKYTFLGQNFHATTLSWGFASGYCSSEFIASPGEIFFAPVTLSTLPGTAMFGLDFSMIVTNLGSDMVPSGDFGFTSMLMELVNTPSGPAFEQIPPLMFAGNAVNPPPPSQLLQLPYNGSTNFVNLTVPNTNLNRLAVGWFETFGNTNLFNTKSQNLLTYSLAFVQLIPSTPSFPNQDIVGSYFFQVPTNATPGEQYQIQLDRASGNGDGLDGPNSDVPVILPLSGSLTNGAINAIKVVTVGQPKYLAGDIYPFHWLNAGDFGSGDLTNHSANDIIGTFNAAVYDINGPPPGSDFYDAMDSAGGIGTFNAAAGYWTKTGTLSGAALNALFNVNDATTINTMAFGDGNIDICDVFATFARSQFPNMYWFERYYTNDPVHGVFGRIAQAVFPQTNVFINNNGILSHPIKSADGSDGSVTSQAISITNTPVVHFSAGDYLASAGQTVSIPITMTVFGPYASRMMMLNVAVVPLDGSPALTAAPTFTLNAPFSNSSLYNPPGALGVQDNSHGNYAAAFLPTSLPISTNADVMGSNIIGYLNVTIPANATSSSAYALHFNHASASPNGLVSFPKTIYTGLITLSSRTNSNYGDDIPDSWRLRYFGTIYNQLSVSNADADGTGMNNYQKYLAGLDPQDPTSVLNEGTDQPMAQSSQDHVVYWPTVNGKTYTIERSATLFPGQWTSISTNIGTGTYMEIHDAPAGANYFYRVSTK